MTQKYAVYLNGKALLFNNPQAVHPQVQTNFVFSGNSSNTLAEALNWLEIQNDPHAVAYLPDLPFREGVELLKKKFVHLRAAGGIVTEPDGKILMINRLEKWDLPKGKAEAGEEDAETAVREIQEETLLPEVTNPVYLCSTWHTYPHKGHVVIKETVWFHCLTSKAWPLVPQTEEQISQAVWASPEQLTEMLQNTYPSIVDVFEAFGSK